MGSIKLLSTNKKNLLLKGLRDKNPFSQREFYEQNVNRLYTICLRYIKNEEDATDAMNQSFFKIFEKIKQFKEESSIDTWTSRITINTCINFINSTKTYRNTFIHTDEFKFYGVPTEEEGDETQEWWDSALSIPSETFFMLIKELPPASRIVFNLYVIDDYSHQQIAKELNISEGTSKWHLNNSRNILREKIREIIDNNLTNYATQKNN